MNTAPLLSPSNKRGNWLGKVVEQLKQALSDNGTETFETLYTDTITSLKYKYLECKQLTLPLHPRQPEERHITCCHHL